LASARPRGFRPWVSFESPSGSARLVIPRYRYVIPVVLFAAACRAGAPRAELPLPPPAPAPGDTTCTFAAGRAAPRDTVRLAVTDPVDPGHAPLPRNDAERLGSVSRVHRDTLPCPATMPSGRGA